MIVADMVLDKQRIIGEALALLDAEGLEGVSLRKLAKRLDVQAPALYWHFNSKAVLLDWMAEAILSSEFADLAARKPDETWQGWLSETIKRLRKAMLSRREGARVVAGAHMFPAVTLMKLFEISMESLVSAGIELPSAGMIVSTAVHFAFGRVIEEQASPSPEELENFGADAFLKDYPLMTASVNLLLRGRPKGHGEFEDCLSLIINGATMSASQNE